ncbi:MAG: hypothetical protein JG770_649 [Mahella sp.]|nr:hypothetical protein [Mahella sp.]
MHSVQKEHRKEYSDKHRKESFFIIGIILPYRKRFHVYSPFVTLYCLAILYRQLGDDARHFP